MIVTNTMTMRTLVLLFMMMMMMMTELVYCLPQQLALAVGPPEDLSFIDEAIEAFNLTSIAAVSGSSLSKLCIGIFC